MVFTNQEKQSFCKNIRYLTEKKNFTPQQLSLIMEVDEETVCQLADGQIVPLIGELQVRYLAAYFSCIPLLLLMDPVP